MRGIIYPNTVIEVHITDSYQGTRELSHVYERWIEGSHEEVGASIKHLAIDDLVEIDLKPDGPVPERPHDQARREKRQKRELLLAMKARGEPLTELEIMSLKAPLDMDSDEKKELAVGDWAITCTSWLDDGCVGQIESALHKIEKRRQQCGTVVRLGKAGIQELVKAYIGNRWDHDTEEDELYGRFDEEDESWDGDASDEGDYLENGAEEHEDQEDEDQEYK